MLNLHEIPLTNKSTQAASIDNMFWISPRRHTALGKIGRIMKPAKDTLSV